MMTTIIGISGKIGAGKDYLTGKLIEVIERSGSTHGHTAFAEPLKAELDTIIETLRNNPRKTDGQIARILDKQMSLGYDNAYRITVLLREEVTTNLNLDAYSRTVKIRTALQDLGTRIRRAQKASYWTDMFLKTVNSSAFDYMFVSDARFPNEMDTVVDNEGVGLRLEIPERILKERREKRDGIEYTPEQLNHISETALDDYTRFDIIVTETFDAEQVLDNIKRIHDQKHASRP